MGVEDWSNASAENVWVMLTTKMGMGRKNGGVRWKNSTMYTGKKTVAKVRRRRRACREHDDRCFN